MRHLMSPVIFFVIAGLLVCVVCEQLPRDGEFLMDAHELLGVDLETFEKRLEEQFIV